MSVKTLDETARRIGNARPACKERVQPCPHCASAVYAGCVYLALAALTEPEKESAFG